MKYFLKFLPIVAVAAALCSCGSSDSDSIAEKVEYIPVKLDRGDNWSFMSPDGKVILEDEFERTPSLVVDGIFSVYEGNGFSVYAVDDKKPVLVPGCEELKSAGYYSENLIPVVHPKERIQFVDKNGLKKFELAPFKGKEIVSCEPGFSDGLLRIRNEEGKYGFINAKGEVVIEPKFDIAGEFAEGMAIVGKSVDDNYSYSVIDKKGDVKFKFKKGWDPHSPYFKDGVIVVDDDDRMVFVNANGEAEKCPTKVKSVVDYNSEIFVFYDGDHYGVANRKNNEIVIRARYDFIFILPDGDLLCKSGNDKYSVRNLENEVLVDLSEYEGVRYINSRFNFVAGEYGEYELLKRDGTPVKDSEFYASSGDLCATYEIESDYFDLNAMASTIAGLYNGDGIGQYTLGKTPGQLTGLGSAEDYSYKTVIDGDEGSGFRWEYKEKIYFSSSMADYNISYDNNGYFYYNYTRNYYWNTNSHIYSVDVNVSAETTLGKDAVKALAQSFKNKGYTEDVYGDVSGSWKAYLHKGNFAVKITSAKNSGNLLVEGMEYSTDTVSELRRSVSGNDSNVEEATEEVVAEEVIAVEEAE